MLASETFRRLRVARNHAAMPPCRCFFFGAPAWENEVFSVVQNKKWVFMSGFSAMSEVTLRGLPYGGPWSERAEKSIPQWEKCVFRRLRSLNASQ